MNKPTYQIFGRNALEEPASPFKSDTIDADIEKGLVVQAESVEDLAEKIGIPATNLKRSIDNWNENVANGRDGEYQRTVGLASISGPYYAYRNTPGNLGAIGGLKINVNCNVLDLFNQPITGLYAAGLNAGGWIGSYYPGSGTAIGGIIHQGRRAAKSILGLN